MAAEDDDVAMASDAPAPAEEAAAAEEAAKEPELSVEERVTKAESAKGTGNELLKAGDLAAAIAKYAEGLEFAEPLLSKDEATKDEASGDGEALKKGRAVYLALRLNSAQACLKHGEPSNAAEHASKALEIDGDNAKALYRRAMASMEFDSESRMEQAASDFARLAKLEPGNREARDQLAKARERLREAKQLEKKRYCSALQGGGLYQEQHDKTARQRVLYEEEAARRKEASEDDITFEDWQKKQKEKQEADVKKEKEDREKKRDEDAKMREQSALDAENERRKAEGLEVFLTLGAWRDNVRMTKDKEKEDVVNTNEMDLDDEDKKLLTESKKKGYYHGRLGTVLSSEAPKPQLSEAIVTNTAPSQNNHSEWNKAGTWEEKDATAWAKEALRERLKSAKVSTTHAALPTGEAMAVTAKVSSVKTLTGDAQMILVRNKRRHGFNFEAELSFHLVFTPLASSPSSLEKEKEGEPATAETWKGTFKLPEIADFIENPEIRIEAKWSSSGSPPARLRSLAEEWLEKLRGDVRAQVAAFAEEYKAR